MSIVLIFSLLLSLVGLGGTVSATEDVQAGIQSMPDRLIVQFKPGTTPETMEQVFQNVGATLERDLPQIEAYVIEIPAKEGLAGNFSANTLKDFDEVAYVEPDYVVSTDIVPNDTNFNEQWGMALIQAPEAWSITHSSSEVTIAILDSGIDSRHPDLSSKIVAKKNFSNSSTVEDQHGHGTHVAGIAAAATNNSLGVAGVAYNASLMNVKVLGDSGSGAYSQIAQGIIWAADNSADVINLSLGGSVSSSILGQAIDYAWDKGAVVVAAAGNNGSSNPSYPAYYENCIAVAATDTDDNLYSFSNYGNWVDVAAPGAALSTVPGNSYKTMRGTSMASPFVAGLAGLLYAIAEDTNGNGKTNDEIRSIIQNSTDDIKVSGIGNGRINAYNAVTSITPPAPAPSPTPTPTPAPSPTPAPINRTFGLDNGNNTYDQHGNAIQAMRFQNTAGDGRLTGLEILIDDPNPTGKVRLGVYADDNGRPGHLLVDGGEVDVVNGWVSTNVKLNLPVRQNTHYWLAFNMDSDNGVQYQSSGSVNVHHWADNAGYGILPGNYPPNENGANGNQYVMRAIVSVR